MFNEGMFGSAVLRYHMKRARIARYVEKYPILGEWEWEMIKTAERNLATDAFHIIALWCERYGVATYKVAWDTADALYHEWGFASNAELGNEVVIELEGR